MKKQSPSPIIIWSKRDWQSWWCWTFFVDFHTQLLWFSPLCPAILKPDLINGNKGYIQKGNHLHMETQVMNQQWLPPHTTRWGQKPVFQKKKRPSLSVSSKESARFIEIRMRTAERYPQTPVFCAAHNLQDTEINSNLFSPFTYPLCVSS